MDKIQKEREIKRRLDGEEGQGNEKESKNNNNNKLLLFTMTYTNNKYEPW